jgi:DegV family protein with EDD domain
MMRPYLEAGEDILYLAFSSGLSGTCEIGMVAKSQLDEEFPERRVLVVDTLCASLGQGLIVSLAVEKMEAGLPMEEVAAFVEETKLKVHHWFTVDDLNFLRRGGRVSGAAAFLGTMLSIKPVLNVDDAGHLIPKEKQQGRKRALKALVDHLKENCQDPAKYPITLSHGDALADAQYVDKLIREQWASGSRPSTSSTRSSDAIRAPAPSRCSSSGTRRADRTPGGGPFHAMHEGMDGMCLVSARTDDA